MNTLLETELGVGAPLHISLSRPLLLTTTNKDLFLAKLRRIVDESGVRGFDVQTKDPAWHPNESESRWFLVLRLAASAELDQLLLLTNKVASDFDQPLLYDAQRLARGTTGNDQFHVSLAWSLLAPGNSAADSTTSSDSARVYDPTSNPARISGRLQTLSIAFSEVKIRIGQDVYTVPLKFRRRGDRDTSHRRAS